MRAWQNTINVSDLWKQARSGELSPKEMGRQLAARVRSLGSPSSLKDVFSMLEGLDDSSTFDDFDVAYAALCDWADVDKRLWIQTY